MPTNRWHDLGRHIFVDTMGSSFAVLDDRDGAELVVREAVEAAGAQLLQLVSQRFENHGFTLMALLSESHVSLHTWPEHGAAALDFYTCGPNIDMDAGVAAVIKHLSPEFVDRKDLKRGAMRRPSGRGDI